MSSAVGSSIPRMARSSEGECCPTTSDFASLLLDRLEGCFLSILGILQGHCLFYLSRNVARWRSRWMRNDYYCFASIISLAISYAYPLAQECEER